MILTKNKQVLIDADFILYRSAASCETEIDFGDDVIVVTSRFSDLQRMMRREINNIRDKYSDYEPLLFFSSPDNFRKKIMPDYKGERTRKKPCGFKRAINWLENEYKTIIFPTLEADDGLGIWQTTRKDDQTVIVSPDKDMRQIPGRLFDFNKETYITEDEGDKWFLTQALAGDTTDGYSGCPGYGPAKAEKLFNEKGYSWKTVVTAYREKGLTRRDALTNARLARILRHTDYDKKKKEPILWTPSTYKKSSRKNYATNHSPNPI